MVLLAGAPLFGGSHAVYWVCEPLQHQLESCHADSPILTQLGLSVGL